LSFSILFTGTMAPAASPPALQEATKNSTTAWQLNLESLFHQAKDRFPDVVWELTIEGDEKDRCIEEVWGHKGMFEFLSLSLLQHAPPDLALQPECQLHHNRQVWRNVGHDYVLWLDSSCLL
jgi:hypothetical protein